MTRSLKKGPWVDPNVLKKIAKAKPGDRLLRVGFPDDSVILISACENGNLCVKLNGVECTQTAASFKEWSPALGDVHDFKHRFYQEILPYEGHFHTQAAALYRCIQQNEAAWDHSAAWTWHYPMPQGQVAAALLQQVEQLHEPQ